MIRWSSLRFVLPGPLMVMPTDPAPPTFTTKLERSEEKVLDVEALRLQAMLDGDVETLDRITGADYMHVESTGRVRTKEQFLEGFKDRTYHFRSFAIERNDVKVLGSVAVVTGRYRNVIETRAGVQPVKHARHLRVYAFRDGAWINVVHQATEISPHLR